MAKKNKKGSRAKEEEKEFDLPEGLNLLETKGWGTKLVQWLKNNFSAIILPIIALIILGGGIYLYSQQKGGEKLEISQEELGTGITIDLEEEEALPEEEVAVSTEKATTKEEVTPEVTEGEGGPAEEIVITPQVSKGSYAEIAAKGEGITHLARRALKTYLQGKTTQLTPEHKIYIEDYLQNRTGTRGLRVGEEISFSRVLIEEAIGQAQKLTATQLHNLEQYSRLVPSLNY